jgi:hypothetical protein
VSTTLSKTPSNYDAEHLYALLPAVYRQRDAEQAARLGLATGPLRDLVEILAAQAVLVERDIFRLYENWFVETCEPWVVPYIGDLIGVRGTNGAGNPRAEVANTLGYRQSKGTAAMLERLARDVTGWPARVVEYFALLATTQHVNHVRRLSLRTPDLRRAGDLERLGGPFETAAHTGEVRRIALERGRYDIPNVGLFLWRLQAYPLERVIPKPADATNKNFTFDVLGRDEPLFHAPVAETAETDAAQLAAELNVPAPIRRRSLNADLASYYGAGLDLAVWPAWTPPTGSQPPQAPLAIADIVACDLTDWNRPRPAGKVAVDPVLGRVSFPAAVDPAKVRVSCHYGFSDDLGGGPYQREASFTEIAGETTFRVGENAGAGVLPTIQAALTQWNGKGSAVIEIADSRTYAEVLTVPAIPAKGRLELRAADEQRPALVLAAELKITGAAGSRFEVNGLLIAGGGVRIAGALDHVLIQHATLAPGEASPALIVESGVTRLEVSRSILGAVRTSPETTVSWSDSMIDADTAVPSIAYAALDGTSPGGLLTVSRCTVRGEVRAAELALAENSLFLDPVTSLRRQAGCVRFCYVAPGSRTPRRFHCQPTDETPVVAGRLRPRFTSLRHGDPGYCQLTLDTPPEIRRGAEDESEMGAFASLRQPQREDALRIRLAEYLRVGLEAGIFFPT